jgi:hypothetical protein
VRRALDGNLREEVKECSATFMTARLRHDVYLTRARRANERAKYNHTSLMVDHRGLATRLRCDGLCGGCSDTFAAPCIVFASWLEYPQRMACERKWQVGIGR